VLKTISVATTFGGIGDFISGIRQIKERRRSFDESLFKLNEGKDQAEFADQVARIGLQIPI